jgi:hypothetical protein
LRNVKVAFAVGMALMVAVGAAVLTRSPPRVLRAVSQGELVGRGEHPGLFFTSGDAAVCQANEVLPAGVSGIRLWMLAIYGAQVHVAAFSGSQVLTEGSRGADWTGQTVTVPVKPVAHTTSHVKLCFAVEPNSEPIVFRGALAPPRETAEVLKGATLTPAVAAVNTERPLVGRIGVEYLAAGQSSWWSRVTSVAKHMGLGRAYSGTWIALLVAALMAAVGALALRLTLRELPGARSLNTPGRSTARGRGRVAVWTALRRVPTAAWVCALIAFLNAAAWSIITPPLQGKDEIDHFAYVARLAETGTLPENGNEKYSPRESLVVRGLHYFEVRFTPPEHTISTAAEQRTLIEDADTSASLEGVGGAGVATSEPPLYYALQVIPYTLGGSNVLVQLQLMRLFGALLGALTALLTFFFLREVLTSDRSRETRAPGTRRFGDASKGSVSPSGPRIDPHPRFGQWTATVGALCVALQPLLGFMSGSVNPDSMLYTVAAAVFLCLARAFRRGLTRRLAVTLGLLIAVGFMTKLNFLGLAFGVFAGLVVLSVREARSQRREAWRSLAIAAGIGVVPVSLYVLRNVLENHPALGAAAGITGVLAPHVLFKELSYVWEMYLPRLPGMVHYFEGMRVYKDVWFDRSVGLYGWMDTVFPIWVDNLALVPAGAVALLCGRELFVRRAALRTRLSELGVYAAITVGVLMLVGLASYKTDVVGHELAFGEPRYLLPMLPLLGAVIVLAVRGAGRRWTPVVGAALVVLFLGHDVFSQLQVIARYYG